MSKVKLFVAKSISWKVEKYLKFHRREILPPTTSHRFNPGQTPDFIEFLLPRKQHFPSSTSFSNCRHSGEFMRYLFLSYNVCYIFQPRSVIKIWPRHFFVLPQSNAHDFNITSIGRFHQHQNVLGLNNHPDIFFLSYLQARWKKVLPTKLVNIRKLEVGGSENATIPLPSVVT